MIAPTRIHRQRTEGWRRPAGAVIVDRTTKWGNPFLFEKVATKRGQGFPGLVRYRPSDPQGWEFEGRVMRIGRGEVVRHDWFGPGPEQRIVEMWARWATRAEIVELYRRTLLDPDPGMIAARPSRGGRLAPVTVDDIRAELAGKDLACWCPPGQPCHAEVLLELANPTPVRPDLFGTPEPSPGAAAVSTWSRTIHGRGGDRHEWATACIAAMDAAGPDVALPPFPSPFAVTRQGRDETVRRLWRTASGTAHQEKENRDGV